MLFSLDRAAFLVFRSALSSSCRRRTEPCSMLSSHFLRSRIAASSYWGPVCGNVVPLYVQVCNRCGHDLDFPEPRAQSPEPT